jgi:quercetin dioxygenase-like cupin family protein
MPESITRTVLQRFDVPDGSYETIIMLVEMQPTFSPGLHTHPGFDAAYMLEGNLTVIEHGQPDKEIRARESWRIRPGSVHEVNVGNGPAKVLAIYVVERGKPLATPWMPPNSN